MFEIFLPQNTNTLLLDLEIEFCSYFLKKGKCSISVLNSFSFTYLIFWEVYKKKNHISILILIPFKKKNYILVFTVSYNFLKLSAVF